jgi:hypothetical protein
MELLLEKNSIPKETNPPLVFKSSKASPLNSGGGMADQVQGGVFIHLSEFPTSISSCHIGSKTNELKVH